MTATRATLLPEELQALQDLSIEAITRQVPTGHGRRLVRCGFATHRTGALAITMTGRAELVIEITRSSWIPVLIRGESMES